jgi:N-acetylneuraminic acid mutarotase
MLEESKWFGIALRHFRAISLCAFTALGMSGCGGGGGGGGGGGSGGGGMSACGSSTAIDPNSTTTAALTAGDCTLNDLFPGSGDSSLVDQYSITLSKNGTLTVRMDSAAVDSLLLLFSSLQQPLVAQDDDGGGGTNALINTSLSAGTYIVLANTASTTASVGAYTLTSTFVPAAWIPTSSTGAPEARTGHTAVWSDAEMLLWGGHDGNSIAKNTGARFSPVTNTWIPIATAAAPSPRLLHTAIWTGTEMIVWGGFSGAFAFQALNDGAKYSPQTDTWTPITAVGAPAARSNHIAIWTGTEMIVWGGYSSSDSGISGGARYNPVTNTWTPISAIAAPSARGDHSAVWTGSKMIVWGGRNGGALIGTGGVYDPVSDSWLSTNLTAAPAPRSEHAAAWTGSAMIIFGGRVSTGSTNSFNTGGLYNPMTDSWTQTNIVGAPIFTLSPHMPSVWTGTELIIWGDGGGRYNPAANSWSGISTSGAPSTRRNHSLIWTGSTAIGWGGDFAGPLDTGGIYDPSVDQTP